MTVLVERVRVFFIFPQKKVDAQVEVSVGVLQEKINVLQKERDVLLAAATQVLPKPAPVWMGDCPLSLDNILRCRAPMTRMWNAG